ncbi:MAG: hypothetical protein U0992_18740 [Planctomycetaceae bacterium]
MSAVILLKLICLSSLGLVAYCYAAYPLLVSLCARLIGRRDVDDAPSPAPEQWPFVSLIIAAYKEERTIPRACRTRCRRIIRRTGWRS